MRIKIFIGLLILTSTAFAQNNGTITGAVYSTDVPTSLSNNGYSLHFDGIDDKVVPAQSMILQPAAGSLSIWFKISGYQSILLSNSQQSQTYINIENVNYVNIQTDEINTFQPFLFGGSGISLNTWHHLAIVRNNGTTHVYIDGSESISGGLSQPTGTMTFNQMGIYFNNSGAYVNYALKGNVSDLKVYNEVLSASQVTNIYTGTALTVNSSLYWKMNEGNGLTVLDSQSGSGNGGTTSSTSSQWITSGNNIYNSNTGNVGIGTSKPTQKLSVNGTLLALKVKVSPATNTTDWPDYVFDKKYKLPSLDEIEEYTKVNKHLPGIPSAQQVLKTGIDVGENQALLLKKIEELTLIMINQQKAFKKAIKKQNIRIQSLEKGKSH